MGTTLPARRYWTILKSYELLFIEGKDAKTFLQGQVTCNVNDLTTNNSLLGCHCNAKGRVIFDFRAGLYADDKVALRVKGPMLNQAKTSLGKYIVFSKAKITHPEQPYRVYGFFGVTAGELMSHVKEEIYEHAKLVEIHEQLLEVWVAPEYQSQFESMVSSLPFTSEADWMIERMKSGIAELSPDLVEQYVPQDIDLDEAGAINFKKGCYTGQEVIARLHYRGASKRHLYVATLKEPASLLPGDKIMVDGTQSLGEVIEYCSTLLPEHICLISASADIEVAPFDNILPVKISAIRKAFA